MEKLYMIRIGRDYLLQKTDWTQLLDVDLTDSQRQEWKKYRQALRDLPASNKNPDKIVFPKQPE